MPSKIMFDNTRHYGLIIKEDGGAKVLFKGVFKGAILNRLVTPLVCESLEEKEAP